MIDYPAHLEAMWQKAIVPREPDAPTVISTFAGGGGSLTGYMMAGYRDLLAVEWDDNAVETLCLNWPDLDIYHGDIAGLTVDEVLQRTGLKVGELDILDGSPPCQGFSTAGKRQLSDARNQLFNEFVRLLRGLQPKVFIMENVSGMIKGKMKIVFAEVMRELKASGYKVSTRLLNAMYFHVPQSRQRLIFIGVRDDLGIEPSHPGGESRKICAICSVDGVVDTHNPYGKRKFNQAMRFLSHHNPSCTLTKSEVPGADLPWIGSERIGDKRAQVIASFPLLFRFDGTWKDAINVIGNSVPPLFMEAIARHVRIEILNKVELELIS